MNDLAISTTAVDLSQLPAPTIVEQLDFEAIRDAMLADVAARFPDFSATVESDPVYKLVEACAYRELVVRQRCNEASLGVMLAYAAGADLDQLAAFYAVTRLTITPADPVTGAPAVMESDTDLRARVQLAPESFSVAGPEAAYIYWARSADAGVLDASATSPSPGQVLVSVLSRTGNGAASPALLAAVSAIVNAKPVRPLTDQVTVASAQIVDFQVAAHLTVFDGPDSSVVLAAAQASLQAWLTKARKIGRDVPRAAMIAALFVAGVENVNLVSPAADLAISATQAANCTAIAVDVAGLGD